MTKKWQGSVRCALGVALLAGVAAIPASAALPQNDDGDGPTRPCDATETMSVGLAQESFAFVGVDLVVEATLATIVLTRPSATDCEFTIYPLPSSSWQLAERPAGSAAELTGSARLWRGLVPDRSGTYRVSFTGCPGGCSVNYKGAQVAIAPQTFELVVDAAGEFAVPPEAEPFVPDQPATAPLPPAGDRCPLTGGSVLYPAWVTTSLWTGVGSYRTVEGKVKGSKVSRKDSPFNHATHDVNVEVQPDPQYRNLMIAGKSQMEIEWERWSYPEIFRPTRNDRASFKGYSIYDCSHHGKAEIHPPVMSVAHRPRPVAVPSSLGLGSDIFVPGIVSHLWINTDAGEATDCSATGLHQPYSQVPIPQLCVPGLGKTKNPIKTTYSYDIHLPRNPREVIEPYKVAPQVPLFIDISNPMGSGGPDPVITQDADHPSILHVTLDLTNFTGDSYSRKIDAAWALPAPDNWGMKRWRVLVKKLNVLDDGDGSWRGDGDWKFWANINNVVQEWTKLLDCDGCVHGEVDFGGAPFRTGSVVPASHSLGPDVDLFPGQKIWLMTTGYEEDWAWGDATGDVALSLAQVPTVGVAGSWCRDAPPSGCALYGLHYEIEQVASEVPATLTPAGQALYDGYVVGANELGSVPADVIYSQNWDTPADIVVTPGSPPQTFDLEDFVMQQGPEPSNLVEIGDSEQLAEQLEWMQQESPAQLERFLAEMRADALAGLSGPMAEEVRADLAGLQMVFPDDIWQQYFGDIDLTAP